MVNNTSANKMTTAKTLSQSPSAIRSRERRAAKAAAIQPAENCEVVTSNTKAIKVPKKPKALPTASPIKVTAAQKRSIGQLCAAIASGFLPIASYVMAHIESAQNPMLWILVAAALTFSAPTLANWAEKWCGGKVKAWGFTILLEGVMVFSGTAWLSYAGLAILVVINGSNAWSLAAKRSE